MIDTHCHLDRVPDLDRALDTDLRALVTVGTDAERSEGAVHLAERHERVWAVIGVHPSDAARARDGRERQRIEALAAHRKVVAIGESGFDTYWRAASLEDQAYAFRWQAELARAVGKALVLHVRDGDSDDASRATVAALRASGPAAGVLHCTNGHEALVATGLELGWYVSFAGNLTYPKADAVHRAAATVPEERLLVETDSPFLAPVPHRGRPNVPDNVRHTLAALARRRGVDARALERRIDANAIAIYGLPLEP